MTLTLPEKTPQSFRILPYEVDRAAGVVRLKYAFDEVFYFTETYEFGQAFLGLDEAREVALTAALKGLAVAAGISYYKAFCPEMIELVGMGLTAGEAAFFGEFYWKGLGEFAARGGLDLHELQRKLVFPLEETKGTQGVKLKLQRRDLVLIGGGKDSLASVEMLRKAGEEQVLFAVKPAKPIVACIDESGLPAMKVVRTLDPLLFELNMAGAMNGHVPITGILSFVAVVAAIAFDFDAVILSNERSASEATAVYDGVEVNHQYSKSAEAEAAFAGYVRAFISPSVTYFSLLRPLSEMGIAALFAREHRYDGVFTSCNRAYKIEGASEVRWCCDCPKCRFVFLALATAMDAPRLVAIFGKNMLEDVSQIEGFAALCGLAEQKPWECVGEVKEAAAAIWKLSREEDWRDTAVVKALLSRVEEKFADLDVAWGDVMDPVEADIPPRFAKMIEDAIDG